ncbi:2-oxo-tetronate isomerase [Azospirillum sp. TSO22-1]|uniref:2-oxo-tetronate isomerase n=1 Tax=Azospirillum sp. TSO22-1 TaxID=716789 RepID=UPI000D619863|nr:2-oxo-tetronate isomerase [Azospirillum sp. TSO22-1]PWC31882.1 hydroxypyruvate isomerase [Azospirillum sp. TSO22-1]
MIRLAANLTMQFNELPFLDRFRAAAEVGFRGVEFLFPYDHDPEEVARARKFAGVQVVLFNLPPGDWAAGERGLACLPDRETAFVESVERALIYAEALDCPTLHVMAGIPPAGLDRADALTLYVERLRHAAHRVDDHGRDVVIEPLNSRDMPGYLLRTSDEAMAVIERVGAPNLGLQFDLYHAQIMEGDLTMRMRRLGPAIRHVQIAGVPDRHEPDSGECDPHHLLRELDATGYAGWVGCEYRPRTGTLDGLGWARRYLHGGA